MSGIDSKLAGLSAEQRAFVELQLQRSSKARTLPSIPVRPDGEAPALSFAQQRLWLMSQLDPGSPAYVMPGAARLTGPLNVQALEGALNAIVERHETLRTTFVLAGDEPQQIVQTGVRVPVDIVDLSGMPAEAREVEARQIAIRASREPFDLAAGPLLRAAVIKLGADDHVLVLTAHHIVSDGWSMAIFVRELGELYRAFDAGVAPSLPPLPIQYADFAVWQRGWLQGNTLAPQLDYWKRDLAGASVLQLPLDRPRPAVPGSAGAFESLTLGPDMLARLRELGQADGGTLFMTLLAGFDILLARYCGEHDIAVGSPIANRTRAELEGLIGCFVNTLVMRTDLSGDPTVRTLLARVRETALGAFAHQDLPFERLVDELQPERSIGQNPLFPVIFAYQNAPSGTLDLGRVALSPFPFPLTTARFDLEMHVSEREDQLGLGVCYNTDLFEAPTMRRLLGHYASILAAMVASPDARISELPMLSESERERLLVDFNRTSVEYPRDRCVGSLFDEQVRRAPDALAVVCGSERITYAELNARANQLAHALIARGVHPDDRVAVCIGRSADVVVAALAAIKAGAAYLPLDPATPPDRLAFMLADAAAPVVLTSRALAERLRGTVPVVRVEDVRESGTGDDHAPAIATHPENLAYVIYTSGSTGNPKGVALTHRGLVNLVSWHQRAFEVTRLDRAALVAGLGFDASVWEMWPYLTAGACIHIPEEETRTAAAPLLEWLADSRVTICFAPTPLAEMMFESTMPAHLSLRALLTGGDTLHRVPAGLPFSVHNNYGPTENTVVSTWTPIAREGASAPPPIGRPVDNVHVYVLDRSLNLLPPGIPGELHVGGDSLARGYLAQPELTAASFVPNPFARAGGERLYRTGDRVRWNADGRLEFLGRIDDQVKIRGFRIELGEIEAAIGSHPQVKDAAVLARVDDGQPLLVAYVVPDGWPSVLPWDDLRGFLRERLPDYMVPSAFVALEALPVNASGKVNRRALPAPAVQRQVRAALVLPRTELERRIAQAWREVLRLPEIGVADNFFDLGGHSLRLLQVHGRLVKSLGRDIPIVDLFRFPTIEALAAHLGDHAEATGAPRRLAVQRRIAAGEREPIAVIGMAGRFPGANDVDTLWENVRNGVESISHFTDEEVRQAGYSEALLANPRFVKAFGMVEAWDAFDAGFFGFSAREAAQMDPQHRHFLEVAWEALERAGYDPHAYQGRIGMWAGASPNLYLLSILSQLGTSGAATMATFLANVSDYLPTRTSYKLNLRGPSVNVQSACSTSLVAVHHACQSILNGECEMALAGGVNIKRSIASGYLYEEGGILSPDGHCRAFDAEACGTVGGSGVAVVLLKRLSDAIADGDRIHAVIRGTAINNDGSDKVGYTAPGVQGQADVIKAAQAVAGVDPGTIGYVEAHGTATLLGDPIEIEALSQAFGQRARQATVAVGSLKSNIGHLDAASGVAGLIKAVFAVERGEIPPSLHFVSPNPKMRLDETPFYVSTQLHPWPARSTPRRAGVSAFGIGGTNAHAILEEAPAPEPSSESRKAQVIVLSARSKPALERVTGALAAYLEKHADLPLADVAFTLQVGRRRFRHRRIVVCDSTADLRQALQSNDPKRIVTADATATSSPIAFVFPGQGAQAVNMGRGLYETEPAYRDAIDRCADSLRRDLPGDLRDVLYPDPNRTEAASAQMTQTAWSQPALFVVEYALAQLWQSWGMTPHAMIGHSLGEYVAACLAGVFTLENALTLVAARGRMMQALPPGGMVAIPIDEAAVQPMLSQGLAVATVNGPSATVVSGPFEEIETFERRAAAAGLATRRLVTSHAFHSSMLDPILTDFEALVTRLKPQPPSKRFVSNVTGTWITAAEATDPAYWVRHLRGTVRFGDGLAALLSDGKSIPLEVGPGQGLTSLARRLTGPGRDAVASLASRTGGPSADVRDLIDALGRLWLAGAAIDWASFYSTERRKRVVLPTYPFERQRYEIIPSAAVPQPEASPAGKRPEIDSWLYTPCWKKAPLDSGGAGEPLESFALVLADPGTIGDEIARRLPNAAVVRRAGQFAKTGDREYTVDPARREDFDAVLADLANAKRIPARVVHAWDASDDDGEGAFETLLYSSQAVATHASRPVEITVVAGGLHAVSAHEQLDPRKALMLGLGRVVSQEDPNLRFRTVDVPYADTMPAGLAEQIVRELATWTYDPSVAYRGLERYVEAFDPVAPSAYATRQIALREGGVYLITGGLGAIGLTLAEHLMSSVRARVVLVGRSEPPPRNEWDALIASPETPGWLRRRLQRLKHLESLDGEVIVVRADVTNVIDVRNAITAAERRFGELNGVIHGAVLSGAQVLRPVELLSMTDSLQQLAPKVEATLMLEQALGERRLDFCLLMSSLSAVIGGLQFGAYAAGNAFLDAFAHEHNRRHAVPWVSVNWDNWTMDESAVAAPGSSAVAIAMTHAEGTQAFERVLRLAPTNRVLVSTADLPARIRRYVSRAPEPDDAGAAQPAASAGRPSGTTAADAGRRPMAEWFYVPSWKRSVPPLTEPTRPAARWLIFADDEGVGDEVARRALLQGHDAIIVRSGERFARTGETTFALGPATRDDYTKLLAELTAGPGMPDRIVHCWGAGAPGEATDSACSSGFISLLYLAQALSEQEVTGRMPLFVVTNGAHEVTGLETLHPEHAQVAGALKVLPHEDPRLACVHIDLEAGFARAPETHWRALMSELGGAAPNSSVAYRGGHRWVQTYEPVDLPTNAAATPAFEFPDGGTCLITGGLGGIGLAIANCLARARRARLVLTSRRAVPPRTDWDKYLHGGDDDRTARDIHAIQEIEALGAEVMVSAADVCDEVAMRRVVREAVKRFGGINAVVHSAGLPGGGLIQLKDPDAAARVMAPKTLGTRVLASVLDGQPLDWFVLCSSLTAVIGGPGQVDYCAANAYQDAFAREYSKRTGVRTLAINWDGWRDAGMALETAGLPEAIRARRKDAIKVGIGSDEGADVFVRALCRTDVSQVVVSTTTLASRLREPAAPRPAADQAPPESRAGTPSHTRPELGNDYVAPQTQTERGLCKVWEEILGVSPIGVTDDFFELGGHSLLALQMLSRMRERLGVNVSIHEIFNAPTVAQLAELVSEPGDAAHRERMEELLALVEGVPEEELKNLLAEQGN